MLLIVYLLYLTAIVGPACQDFVRRAFRGFLDPKLFTNGCLKYLCNASGGKGCPTGEPTQGE